MLLNILLTIVLPLFLLMGIGFAVDRAFKLDIQTLNRVGFYVFTPALIFNAAYHSTLRGAEIAGIAVFCLAHYIILAAISAAVFSLRPFAPNRPVLTFGVVFYNAGIYGIPLMLLAFGEDAASIVSLALIVHVVIFFSVGLLWFVGAQSGGMRATLGQIAKYPALYALVIGFGMRALHLALPAPLESSLNYLYGGFVGVALLTLGAQLSQSPIAGDGGSILAVMGLRFALSPLLAALMIPFFGFGPRIAAPLIVGAALPTAVNVYILAKEVDRGANLASRLVFWTTVASAAAIPLVLLLVPRP
jgi:predicted permease